MNIFIGMLSNQNLASFKPHAKCDHICLQWWNQVMKVCSTPQWQEVPTSHGNVQDEPTRKKIQKAKDVTFFCKIQTIPLEKH